MQAVFAADSGVARLLWLQCLVFTPACANRGGRLLSVMVLEVFLSDAAALEGLLRILSFPGLGMTPMGVGWAHDRFAGRASPSTAAVRA